MASAIFFEEKQVNAPWMGWTAVFIGLGALVFVLLKLSDRWHSTGSIAELIAGGIGVVLITGTIAWLAFTHHLFVTIDREGINYTYVPTFYEPKRIAAAELISYELRKLTSSEMFESSKTAKKLKNKMPQKEICTVGGWMVADLRLKDGRQILLGTHNPDGLLWALKRLQNHA